MNRILRTTLVYIGTVLTVAFLMTVCVPGSIALAIPAQPLQTVQNQSVQNQPVQNQSVQNQPVQNQPVQNDTTSQLDNGGAIFALHCAGCHLKGGNIVRRGKNLKLKTLQKNGYDTVEAIATITANGKNNMSAYRDRLTPAEIAAVSAYVLHQAQNNWQ